MSSLRVGVLMGGKSIEREVSFNSGRTVCDHLDTSRYSIIPIFQRHDGTLFILPWKFLHRGKITDFEHRLATEAEAITWDSLKDRIDFMYIATHGSFAEDGTLQGMLEVLNIPYLGSDVLASALCMDKIIQKHILAANGIIVPRGFDLTAQESSTLTDKELEQKFTENNLSFPCVVKPYAQGSSMGVAIVFDTKTLGTAIKQASLVTPEKPQAVIIEEKIEGMEFSCITLFDYKTDSYLPLPPTEIVPEDGTHFFDYTQKYMPGRAIKFTPPRCAPEIVTAIQETCLEVTRLLGITTISRIDGFVTKDKRIVIVDPNTISGMGPASFLFREAAEINMSHTQLINHLIETELHTYGMLAPLIKKEKKAQSMNTKKLRVAVLLGGPSNEREISLESGRNIVYKLSPHTYETIPVFVDQSMRLYKLNQSLLVRNSTHEIAERVDDSMLISWQDLPAIADFVFIGLHGGPGENGCVQGTLEMLGLPYNGSGVLASALCMDKFKTTGYLRIRGFDVPQATLVAKSSWQTSQEHMLKQLAARHAFPCIVKPHDDGCSVMVAKAHTIAELTTALDTIFASGKEHGLVEEYITGMELTVGVIGNDQPKALIPSQAVASAGILSIEEKFLPGAGENQTPAPLPEEKLTLVQKTMEQVYLAVGCKGYARIDCFYQPAEKSPTGKERVVIIEINTLPGMTPATCIFHQAAELGIKPMDFVDKIVQLGLEECGKSVAPVVSTTQEKQAHK